MKKNKVIFLSVTLVCTIVAALILIPWSTPFDQTLTALKLDEYGNELGMVQVRITGKRTRSLFSSGWKDVTIHAFDDIYSIEDLDPSKLKADPIDGYLKLTFAIGGADFDLPTKDDPTIGPVTTKAYACYLSVSEGLEDILIHIRHADGQEVYYALSFDMPVSELAEHFSPLLKSTAEEPVSVTATCNG